MKTASEALRNTQTLKEDIEVNDCFSLNGAHYVVIAVKAGGVMVKYLSGAKNTLSMANTSFTWPYMRKQKYTKFNIDDHPEYFL